MWKPQPLTIRTITCLRRVSSQFGLQMSPGGGCGGGGGVWGVGVVVGMVGGVKVMTQRF